MNPERRKKRYRIHPAIACTGIMCLTILAIISQVLGNNSTLKIFVAGVIAFILGVKVRVKLPIT